MKLKKTTRLQRLSIALGLIGIALFIGGTLRVRSIGVSHAQEPQAITLCYAVDEGGAVRYETGVKSFDEVYGKGGYFNEDGTPQIGHEKDYLGECITPNPPATEAPTITETVEVVTIVRQQAAEVAQTEGPAQEKLAQEAPALFQMPDGESENELVPSTGIDLAQAAAAEKAVTTGNILIRFGLIVFGVALVAFGLSRKR